jgi:tryptophan synthase alpha chain
VNGRLAQAFELATRERRVAFIPYVMAGDPDLATTERIVAALTAAGADAIELGIPYSDPLADGPTIACAGARALANGTRLSDVLALVRRCSSRSAPVLLFTYFNPVYQFGAERFAQEAARAGAAGAIVPDCALEESAELRDALRECGLAMPLLVAPSTARERAARIVDAATGFVYVVSRFGVTGAASTPKYAPLAVQLAMLRELTDKPLAVGFGLSRPSEVREVGALADGVVVGSALIDAYVGSAGDDSARRVTAFVAPLIAAARETRGRQPV